MFLEFLMHPGNSLMNIVYSFIFLIMEFIKNVRVKNKNRQYRKSGLQRFVQCRIVIQPQISPEPEYIDLFRLLCFAHF